MELLCEVLPSRDDALGVRVSVVGLDEALLEAGPSWLLASTAAVALFPAVEFFLDVAPPGLVEVFLTRDAGRGSSTSSSSAASGMVVMLFLPTPEFSSPSTSESSGAARGGFPRVLVCENRLEGGLRAAYLALKASCASFSSFSSICLSAATCSIIS